MATNIKRKTVIVTGGALVAFSTLHKSLARELMILVARIALNTP